MKEIDDYLKLGKFIFFNFVKVSGSVQRCTFVRKTNWFIKSISKRHWEVHSFDVLCSFLN